VAKNDEDKEAWITEIRKYAKGSDANSFELPILYYSNLAAESVAILIMVEESNLKAKRIAVDILKVGIWEIFVIFSKEKSLPIEFVKWNPQKKVPLWVYYEEAISDW
jgi:hypothetical protein